MAGGSPMLRAALWYADLGYRVLPCAPGRKTLLTRHGLHDATTDAEQIERWWSEHPDANIAIRTDGLVVIDIDGPENTWLADQPQRRSELERAPTSLTPRGGRQHLFRQPALGVAPAPSRRLARHVDTRADGGYIVVPPSRCNGRGYRWLDGQDLSLSPEGLPEPPAAEPQTVRELLRRCPTLRAPVIVGLLRRGETMNVIAPPKTGKSWLVLWGWELVTDQLSVGDRCYSTPHGGLNICRSSRSIARRRCLLGSWRIHTRSSPRLWRCQHVVRSCVLIRAAMSSDSPMSMTRRLPRVWSITR